jgi:beta-lactam-binding protein with PASTA domain
VTRPAVAAAGTPAPAPAATTVAAAKPVRCVVPKLRGKTLPKAKRLLKRAHCRLGKVARKTSTSVKPGRVIKTRFKAGTRHRAGTRVKVTIAKAP